MVAPQTTAEVAAVVRACAAAGTTIVPQGGNTGLCGGAIPDDSGTQVLLSLSRLNRIRSINADDFSLVAEAGCILADIRAAAARHNRLFPLSLSAEGSCQIGGNLSTDAGGINVIRYGTARQQVLGLEVVLANGEVLDTLRALRKDTAGYDLKQLFIGSEGTLGIITAAVLRLYPVPGDTATAFVAVDSAQDAVRLLARVRETVFDEVQAFELISRRAMEFVLHHIPGSRAPLDGAWAWYALVETAGEGAADTLEATLADALESGIVRDAAIAKSGTEAEQFWRLRHSISEAQKSEGASLKHDIALPVASMGDFLAAAERLVSSIAPNSRPVIFGHVGDGNLHYNISQPAGADGAGFRAVGDALTESLYGLVCRLGGTISAEHGIGTLKKEALARHRSETELALMRTLKRALDPAKLLNPGKVI
jgi:FAD/FMN-containing dehydrogenase